MYSRRTSLILLGMIVTGAGRSVGVKLFYQLGLVNPLVVAGLYLLGQSLSLIVYLIQRFFQKERYAPLIDEEEEERGSADEDCDQEMTACSSSTLSLTTVDNDDDDGDHESDLGAGSPVAAASAATGSENDEETPPIEINQTDNDDIVVLAAPRRQQLKRQGSNHGLTKESEEAISWAHRIPWYFKPIIPAVFNLANATLRWASFIYVPASVAEMLIAGSELILSVIAARIVRKRLVSYNRWMGVGIVTVGLMLIGCAHLFFDSHDDGEDSDSATATRHHTIGNLLILGQSLMSVSQDITEEIFLQEAEFPATLLLGTEGIIGLVLGFLIYLVAAPFVQDGGDLTNFEALPPTNSCIGLTLWFTMTGILNILTTEATSSMTRNVWKNSRTLLVWILGLLIYYLYNTELGEGWQTPESYVIFLGYSVMVGGIVAYYR